MKEFYLSNGFHLGVTFSGIDHTVDLYELRNFLDDVKYDIEFGVLFTYNSFSKRVNRYPSFDWILNTLIPLRNEYYDRLALSLHLCGDIVDDMMLKESVKPWYYLASGFIDQFEFVQLNINKWSYEQARRGLDAFETHLGYTDNIILQYHNQIPNDDIERMIDQYNIRYYLQDHSRGKGIAMHSVPDWIPKVWNGFAGGIGSHNVRNILTEIKNNIDTTPKEDYAGAYGYTWIDMESSLRDSEAYGGFDVQKAKQVYDIVVDMCAEND